MSTKYKTPEISNISIVDALFLLLSKLKHYEYILNIFLLLFLIAPGLMVIAYFREDLLLSLDVLKIILLCLTYSLPFVGLYVFVDFFVSLSVSAMKSKPILSQVESIQSRIDNLRSELNNLTDDQVETKLRAIEVDHEPIKKHILAVSKNLPSNYNFYQPLITGALMVMVLTGTFLAYSLLAGRPDTLHKFALSMLIIGGPLMVVQAILMNDNGSKRLKLLICLVLSASVAISFYFVRI